MLLKLLHAAAAMKVAFSSVVSGVWGLGGTQPHGGLLGSLCTATFIRVLQLFSLLGSQQPGRPHIQTRYCQSIKIPSALITTPVPHAGTGDCSALIMPGANEKLPLCCNLWTKPLVLIQVLEHHHQGRSDVQYFPFIFTWINYLSHPHPICPMSSDCLKSFYFSAFAVVVGVVMLTWW